MKDSNKITLMDTFAKPTDKSTQEPDPCKGWFYRGKVNQYSSGGIIRDDRRLVRLKRMSCKGCDSCDWIDEHLQEEADNEPFKLDDIEHGKLYKLEFVGGGKFWTDCGWEYEGPDTIFTEVLK